MAELAHLRYSLSRRQRLIPLLRIWGPWYALFVVLLVSFFIIRFLASLIELNWPGLLVFGGLAIFCLLFCRGLFVGLFDVVSTRTRPMDVTIEGNGLGILIGDQRWYLFLDGITRISRYCPGVWTLEHWNGCVVNIDAKVITESQLSCFRARMQQGRTPQGIAETIERGR